MRKLFILLIAVALVAVYFAPAMAQPRKPYGAEGMEIKIDGKVNIDTYWTDNDKNAVVNPTGFDDTDLTWDDGGDTRSRFHFAKGPLKAKIDVRDVKKHFASYFAEWNFGPGFLWIGKDDPLTFNPIHLPPPQKSGIGHYIGYTGEDQIRLRFPLGPVTLSFAAQTPTNTQKTVVPTAVNIDNTIPALEARIDFVVGPVMCAISGGMESYEEVDSLNKSYDIDSHVIGFVARYFNGPFSLHGTIYSDTNDYSHGGPPHSILGYDQPFYDAVNDTVIDSETVGWGLAASYALNDMVTFHVGYSEESTESDTSTGWAYPKEDDNDGWEIAAVLQITEFFSITPFYNVTDWDTRRAGGATPGADIDEGKSKAYGARWTIEW